MEGRRTVSTQLTLIFESKYNLVLVEFRPTLVVSSFVKQKKKEIGRNPFYDHVLVGAAFIIKYGGGGGK